jgi:spermidine synthase
MRPNLFQKLCSYFWEVPLETSSSDYNELLQVSLLSNTLQLCSKNAIYSFGEKYDNFYKAFQKIPDLLDEVETVLVLGLGLGSIPYMLEQKFKYDFDYTFVEIDEEVVRLANEYTLQYLESSQQTYSTDAYVFLLQMPQKFDMICMDIFLDDVIPSDFESTDFLKLLKKRINKGGFVLYNRLTVSAKDLKNTELFFKSFKQVFPDASYIDVGGNWLLCSRQMP